jgi:hypothetical protein
LTESDILSLVGQKVRHFVQKLGFAIGVIPQDFNFKTVCTASP